MPSVFTVKEKIEKPMEWYSKNMKCASQWEFDEQLKAYHLGPIYIKQCDDTTSFEDMSENEFFGWDTSSWIELAGNKELIYGYYNDDGSTEFVHIKDGLCIRDYRMYDFELDTDEGSSPEFEDWDDVCNFIDDNLL